MNHLLKLKVGILLGAAAIIMSLSAGSPECIHAQMDWHCAPYNCGDMWNGECDDGWYFDLEKGFCCDCWDFFGTFICTHCPIDRTRFEVFDPDSSLDGGDPVSTSSGAYHFSMPLMDLGGPMELSFTLIYRSDLYFPAKEPSDFGKKSNFIFSLTPLVEIANNLCRFWMEDSSRVVFIKKGDTWVLESASEDSPDNWQPIRYQMEETDDYVYLADPNTEKIYIFQKLGKPGRISRILDRHGNSLQYSYEHDQDNNPVRISDGLGREITLTYDLPTVLPEVRLLSIKGQDGHTVKFGHTLFDEIEILLTSVTDAMNNVTSFNYQEVTNEGQDLYYISGVKKPKGNIPYTQSYEYSMLNGRGAYRVATQTDPYENEIQLSYASEDGAQTTISYPDGSTRVYKHTSDNGYPKSFTDSKDKTITFSYNENHELTAVTNQSGNTIKVTYHSESGNLESLTDTKGAIMSFQYTAQSQEFTNPINGEKVSFTFYKPKKVVFSDLTKEEFEYDSKGNYTKWIDRKGNTWRYEYNTMGLQTKATNPLGGTREHTYNPDGTPASFKDSDIGTTKLEYDSSRRLIKIVNPDNTFINFAYNDNGQITSFMDERGKTFTFGYDVNGNMTKIIDPFDKETTYSYDLLDRRVTTMTNRCGKKIEYSYNNLRMLASIKNLNGNTIQYSYDTRGWPEKITTGQSGKIWKMGYDDEGNVVSFTTPSDNTMTFQRDESGNITKFTSPLGNSRTAGYDAFSRITSISDELDRKTSFTYDERGLLTTVSKPDIGSATYTYNELGDISKIADLNGKDWAFSYSAMGMPKGYTDPLGNSFEYSYNLRGFLTEITYPTEETQERAYDNSGNIIRRLYSDGTDLQYTYDDIGRLLTSNNIKFNYNEEGQTIYTESSHVSFGATHDDGGRLKTVTYADGLFSVTYEYDARNLLVKVTDDLTNKVLEFTYNDDGLLRGIKRSNNIDTAYTWDADGHVTNIQHGTVWNLAYTYNEAGEITKCNYNLPIDPAAYLESNIHTYSYNAASEISSSGYSYDACGRQTKAPQHTFKWAGDDRLIAMDDVEMAYNGLGNITTLSHGDTTTEYYYNHAIGLYPIVAEREDQWKRFYVLTPEGILLYMIDASEQNEAYFYHYDVNGNTIFLSDANGNITDSYAYTPYGVLLHHDGGNNQPYTFGGAFQTRREGDSNLYQMRARYYEAGTARFISREPLWPISLASPRRLNPYQYALNNPLMYVDPDGLEAEDSRQVAFIIEGFGLGGHAPDIKENLKKFFKEKGYFVVFTKQDTFPANPRGMNFLLNFLKDAVKSFAFYGHTGTYGFFYGAESEKQAVTSNAFERIVKKKGEKFQFDYFFLIGCDTGKPVEGLPSWEDVVHTTGYRYMDRHGRDVNPNIVTFDKSITPAEAYRVSDYIKKYGVEKYSRKGRLYDRTVLGDISRFLFGY